MKYHVQPPPLDKLGDSLHAFSAFTTSVCNLRPTLRGTVHVTSADSFAASTITSDYLSTEEDRKVAVDSLHLTHHIVARPALAQYKPEEYLPGATLQTDEELVRVIGKISTIIFHPAGTRRMGRVDDANAVVNAQLRVCGIEGLRVVDTSVMPTTISGNTNPLMITIAGKTSEMIRATRKVRTRGGAVSA